MAAQRSDYWKRVGDYKKHERSEIEKDRRHPLNNALEQCSDVIVRLRQPQLQAINKWKRELALKPLTCIHEYLLRFMDFKQEDLDPHRDLICRTWSSLSEFDEIVQRITTSGACEVPCSRIHVSLPFFGCMDPGVDSNDLDRGMHNVELLKEEIAQAIHRSSLKVVYSQSAASSETATLLQHKVGVAFRLGKLLQCIADGSISVVAIIGESGLGKTTLLEAAVQMIQGTKDYVVAAIQINRELRKEQLLDLQSQLIRQLGGAQKKLRDLEQGRLVIQRLMRMLKEQGKRVCLAIDNVVHSSHLKEALPENLAELLPISTCIFITTRSEAVAHDLQKLFEKALPSGFSYFLHKPAQLTHLECMDLFSFYATKSQGPLEEKHENMIDLIVNTCEGLPLALILLGSYFDLGKNRKKAAWINVAQRLQHGQVTGTPHQMIFTILEVVFESLQPPDLQESFLDVVLFFHGHDWNTVQYSVGKNILQELVARHLIFQEVHLEAVLGKKNYHLPQRIFDKDCGSSFVGVHDLIYDFARSKKDALELSSGLLISAANDIPSADDPVLERVRGLSLRECTVKGRQLEQMLSLKLLSLQDVVLSGPEIESLSERVAYVNWRLCRQGRNRNKVSALPMNNMEELNVLHLHASKGEINIVYEFPSNLKELRIKGYLQLFRPFEDLKKLTKLKRLHLYGTQNLRTLPSGIGCLTKLRQLALSHCHNLCELSNAIGSLLNLEVLYLASCRSLVRLPEEICNLKRLQNLDLHSCKSLQKLPAEIGQLSFLRKLILSGCSYLTALPDSVGQLINLVHLDVSRCGKLESLPSQIGMLTSLKAMDCSKCRKLKELPPQIGQLGSLELLDCSSCSCLATLPSQIGELCSLEILNLNRCIHLLNLPFEIRHLSSLQELSLEHARELEALPSGVSGLSALRRLNLDYCSKLAGLPATICNLVSLQELRMKGCSNLSKLPYDIGSLHELRLLDLSDCTELEILPASMNELVSLVALHMSGNTGMKQLDIDFGRFPALEAVSLHGCNEIEPADISSIAECRSLRILDLSNNPQLQKLPLDLSNLTRLQILHLYLCDFSSETLPPSIWNLESLRELWLYGNSRLQSLPSQVGTLTALRDLRLRSCGLLGLITEKIGDLKMLQNLDVSNNPRLSMLPIEIGQLQSLKQLNVSSCNFQAQSIPASIGIITSLERLDLSNNLRLESLASGIRSLHLLQELDLHFCERLSRLPSWIGEFQFLKKLDLRHNLRLKKLPWEIGYLIALETLLLNGCDNLQVLPGLLFNLPRLKNITLPEGATLGYHLKALRNAWRKLIRHKPGFKYAYAISSKLSSLKEKIESKASWSLELLQRSKAKGNHPLRKTVMKSVRCVRSKVKVCRIPEKRKSETVKALERLLAKELPLIFHKTVKEIKNK